MRCAKLCPGYGSRLPSKIAVFSAKNCRGFHSCHPPRIRSVTFSSSFTGCQNRRDPLCKFGPFCPPRGSRENQHAESREGKHNHPGRESTRGTGESSHVGRIVLMDWNHFLWLSILSVTKVIARREGPTLLARK